MAVARKKFQGTFTVMDKVRRERRLGLGGTLLAEDQLMILEDYLDISLRRRFNSLPLNHLQLHMLQELVTTEQIIRETKQQKEELESAMERTNSETEEILKRLDQDIFIQEAVRRCIRDIGDGIAWRLFDYDRAVLTEFARRPSGKSINVEGIESELIEFISVPHQDEGIAVLNDLTNYLKLGDVTIRKDANTFEIIEVKKGHNSSGRITRQKQNMRKTVEFLNTGERETEGSRFVIAEVDLTPETLHVNIRRLIAAAEKQGAAVDRIGDFMVVECTDFLKAHDIGLDNAKKIIQEARDSVAKWKDGGELVVDFVQHDRYVQVQNYAPCSILPFPTLARIKLITGALFLEVTINISAILRYFRQRGWEIVKSPQEFADEVKKSGSPIQSVGTIRKRGMHVDVPVALLGRVGFEFLKPKTLVDIFDAMLKMGPSRGPSSQFVTLTGEAAIWD